ncbi:substrate-binding domain-containing protein [uncultured Oscillibacter sp.]|uniref:substrate-binding domain-containing protein n=1 Tax=uncultured Oscillibacter sp. TaxID=876091 RepID=UPI0025DCFA31|nr:substrate-binding domain-containing protein [uncultured Oscillibacter sp.]
MKKVFCLLLTLCMVLALAACGGKTGGDSAPADSGSSAPADSGSDAQQPAGAGGELITVGIINNDPNESGYRTANDAAMRATFTEENGYKATFYNNNDAAQQIATAQQMVQDEVDFLLLSPASTTGWDTVLQDAQAAGTQIILFDRMLEADESMYVAAVVSDMPAEGATAVEWLAAQGLDEYNIIHIQGHMGSDAQLGRTGALDEKVAAEGNWNYVTQQTADWDEATARTITQSVIDSGKPFNVIYAENNGMARGAVAALDAAGITHGKDGDVIVMGFDSDKWAFEAVLTGSWNYMGLCNPLQADTVDSIIKDLAAGKQPAQKIIYTPEQGFDCDTLTQADVDTYGT